MPFPYASSSDPMQVPPRNSKVSAMRRHLGYLENGKELPSNGDPVGEFQGRMQSQPSGTTAKMFTGRQSDAGSMRQSLTEGWEDEQPSYESTGVPRGIPDRSNYRTQSVRVSGSEDLTPEHLSRITSQEVDRAAMGPKRQSYYIDPRTGETVVMPQTLSVSAPRARAFSDRFVEQDKVAEGRRVQMAKEERQAGLDRVEGQKTAALLARAKATDDYNDQLQKRTIANLDRTEAREQSRFDEEQRLASTKSERDRLEARINDPSRHPNDRANDERRLAALNMRESSSGSFQGGLINGRVQNAFNNSVNKATDLASDTSFTPSKDSINRFELGEKQKALENMSQGHELIRSTMKTDPELVSAIDSAREDISRIQREGGSAKLNRWMSNVMKTPLRAIGFNDPYKDFELNDPQVKWVKETADYLTKLVAAKTGQDPKLVRSLIMADLRGSTAGDEPAAVQVKNALR